MVQEPSTLANSEAAKSLQNIGIDPKFDQSVQKFRPHAGTHRDLSKPGKDEEGEDLIYRAKQNIQTNSQLPSILAAKTNPASQQFFDPHQRSNLLPIIRAKESAHLPTKQFKQRHRSVDPRQAKQKQIAVF